MKIHLTRQSGSLFQATNSTGQSILLDGPQEVGGVDASLRPMELILSGLAGCSAVDILLILQQGRQTVDTFEIEVTSERADAIPAVFETIHLHFILSGDISEKKLSRAVDLSIEKYCSVSKMLQPSVKIEYTYTLK